jgi:hypothetical protein
MSTFSYNIFKNPNNDGLFYSDHFHDPSTGVSMANNHGHLSGSRVTHFRNPNTVHPHLHRKWIIDESNSSSNVPVYREPFSFTGFSNASTNTQPNTRPFNYIPVVTAEEVGGTAQTNSAGDYTTSTSYTRVAEDASTFTNASAAAAAAATAAQDNTDEIAQKINPRSIVDGLNSYLDLDQPASVDSFGAKTIKIIPLMSSGIGNLDGKSTQSTSLSTILSFHNIKETSVTSAGNHTHYLPVRGRVINGYTTSDHTNTPEFPNTQNSNNYAKKRVSLMNFNLHRTHNSFNLFH